MTDDYPAAKARCINLVNSLVMPLGRVIGLTVQVKTIKRAKS
jgi:hypothetical protein